MVVHDAARITYGLIPGVSRRESGYLENGQIRCRLLKRKARNARNEQSGAVF